MYIESPMENYNKNNPFVIIAKDKYHKIINHLQSFSVMCIEGIITCLILLSILIFLTMILKLKFKSGIWWVDCVIFPLILVTIYGKLKEKISYFLVDNDAMKEFDELSSLETSDILTLNNERVMKNVNQLYELFGELKTINDFYKLILSEIILTEVICVIFKIVILVLCIIR